MFFEESIEVLHTAVTKQRRHRTDLGGREDAEQVLSKGQPGFDLKLRHCLVVFGNERPLERSNLNPELSRKRAEPQLYISVRSLNEVMCKPFRIFKKRDMEVAPGRRSKGANLRGDFLFDR